MREIKFRAWDKLNKKMSNPVTLGDILDATPAKIPDSMPSEVFYRGLDWLEYTGLKDKNGVEIYEGDVVAQKSQDIHQIAIETRYIVQFGKYDNGETYEDRISGNGWWLREVVFLRGGFAEKSRYEVYDMAGLYGAEENEVIGNIYENPELIGVCIT